MKTEYCKFLKDEDLSKYLVDSLKGFPVEVLRKMCEHQMCQGNWFNPAVFSNNLVANKDEGGFNWENSVEGDDFWAEVTAGDFREFFKVYPKKEEPNITYDYEILGIMTPQTTNLSRGPYKVTSLSQDECRRRVKNGHNTIHSVKREDGAVFTVGDDICKISETKVKTLEKFILKENGSLCVWGQSDGIVFGYFLKNIKHANTKGSPSKKPIFTTHDGVDIYEGDKYWWYHNSTGSISTPVTATPYSGTATPYSGKDTSLTYFSSFEKAEEYKKQQKAIFTTHDGVDIYDGDMFYYLYLDETAPGRAFINKAYRGMAIPTKVNMIYFSSMDKLKEYRNGSSTLTLFRKITDSDQTHELAGIPKTVIQKMCYYQVKQGNPFDSTVFQSDRGSSRERGGFNWVGTEEGLDFWHRMLIEGYASASHKYGPLCSKILHTSYEELNKSLQQLTNQSNTNGEKENKNERERQPKVLKLPRTPITVARGERPRGTEIRIRRAGAPSARRHSSYTARIVKG